MNRYLIFLVAAISIITASCSNDSGLDDGWNGELVGGNVPQKGFNQDILTGVEDTDVNTYRSRNFMTEARAKKEGAVQYDGAPIHGLVRFDFKGESPTIYGKVSTLSYWEMEGLETLISAFPETKDLYLKLFVKEGNPLYDNADYIDLTANGIEVDLSFVESLETLAVENPVWGNPLFHSVWSDRYNDLAFGELAWIDNKLSDVSESNGVYSCENECGSFVMEGSSIKCVISENPTSKSRMIALRLKMDVTVNPLYSSAPQYIEGKPYLNIIFRQMGNRNKM